MRDDFGNLFEIHAHLKTLIRQLQELERHAQPGSAISWRPNVDVIDSPGCVTYLIEIPGVPEEDIVAEIRNRVLIIAGERKPLAAEGESYHCLERPFGTFSCEFVLDTDLDVESAAARLSDGELRITIRKQAPHKAGAIRLRIDVGRNE